MEIITSALETLDIEAKAIEALKDQIDHNFVSCVNDILDGENKIIVTGIGKSSLIAQKFVATLNSTGTTSVFLHPNDALHGDLGVVQPNDIFIGISNSGNSNEWKILLPVIQEMKNKIIAICANENSFLAKQANTTILTKISQEACPHNLAPTASSTAQLAICDALAIAVLKARNFGPADFAKLHPGGMLGKKLKLTIGALVDQKRIPQVGLQQSMHELMLEIGTKRYGAAAVLNDEQALCGIITDGDIRRNWSAFHQNSGLQVKDIMQKSPKTIESITLATDVLQFLNMHKINQIIVTQNGDYMGMVHIHDLLNEGL